jgi:L-glyceraldehyde 3-phosphate reductase
MARNFFLKKEHLTQEVQTKIKKLSNLASARNQALAEMALSWILKDDLVTSVIVGTSSIEQLEMNIKAVKNSAFSAGELEKIDQILKG